MFCESMLQKAWALCRTAQGCPETVILGATGWLEENYRAPDPGTAATIAIHYLMLAMRRPIAAESARGYVQRAAQWRQEAQRAADRDHIQRAG
ncbi:MAG TPA: hypothetical protein VGH16_18620 [Candidatus Binatia bacterium]|jgi:hypothetical protein